MNLGDAAHTTAEVQVAPVHTMPECRLCTAAP